jgi:predicted RNA-binding protein with RPS1 domain
LSESGVARDADVKKAFRVGNTVQVVVQEVDAAARRIRLSVTAVDQVREADEVREYADRPDAAPAEGFGSLADKLRTRSRADSLPIDNHEGLKHEEHEGRTRGSRRRTRRRNTQRHEVLCGADTTFDGWPAKQAALCTTPPGNRD